MAENENTPGVSGDQSSVITEIEAAAVGIRADVELDAIEFLVTDQDGFGFRTWLGRDQAPTLALQLMAATLRLVEARAT